MTAIQKSLLLGIGVAILLGAGFYLVFIQKVFVPGGAGAMATTTQNATTSSAGNGISIVSKDGTVIQAIPIGDEEQIAHPPTDRPITISASIPQGTAEVMRANMEELNTQLQAAPLRVDLWLSLGSYRLIAGDYAGAQEAWSYVAGAGPASINYVAYGNLGDLYMNYLKNYPKAEEVYKKAIAIKPDSIDYYRNLYLLYKDLYKTNTTAARDIVAQGLKANPNNPDLLKLQVQAH